MNRPQGDLSIVPVKPASSHQRSSVCGSSTGAQRTACLQAEVRRGQRETRVINVANDAFAGAAAGTCDARKVIAVIENVAASAVKGALKGTTTIAERVRRGAAKEAVGEATGFPTSAVQAGAAVGDKALGNGGCARRVR